MRIPFLATLFLLAIFYGAPPTAHAAQSYDNCAHFISTLPVVLDKQGVWCMNKNLATSLTSVRAIEITANNVTLDCNDFRISGLGAGTASDSTGIYASSRQNVVVRHCNIRGFRWGISIVGGAGHLLEDNRIDNSLQTGIYIGASEHNMVRRNRVFATGGYKEGYFDGYVEGYFGIRASADIIDNIVDGVTTVGTNVVVDGIHTDGTEVRIAGNRVGGELGNHSGGGCGICAEGNIVTGIGSQVIVGNRVVSSGTGIGSPAGLEAPYCGKNTIAAPQAMLNCQDVGGNISH
jgi:parallel beta-helix repeat protein